ncbi:MAG: hypothetical protein R3Y50_02910 [Rikenellaceae bacterium]
MSKLNKFLKLSITLYLLSTTFTIFASSVKSIETGYTILNVRNAKIDGEDMIVAGSYEGKVFCYDYLGNLKWENSLSGFLNSDIYCADLDGDGSDEILTANADGNIYCLSENGKLLWKFRKNDAPMSSVCVIHKDNKPYVACGGYDNYLYYLDTKGNELSKVFSNSYSKDVSWGTDAPEKYHHIVNIIRPVTLSNGDEILALHGAIHSMAGTGTLYLFEPLASKPYKTITPQKTCALGSMTAIDSRDGEGAKILMGTTSMRANSGLWEVDIENDTQSSYYATVDGRGRVDSFGYRLGLGFTVNDGGEDKTAYLFGRQLLIMSGEHNAQILSSKYSFYDAVKDPTDTKLILASEQSGGSSIHIIDTKDSEWKRGFENIEPKGKLATILANSDKIKEQIELFKLPEWENIDSRPKVYFLSDKGGNPFMRKTVENIHNNYPSPIFLNNVWIGDAMRPDSWQRDTMSNQFFRNRRDDRLKYSLTKENLLSRVKPQFEGDSKGLAMWGGHGNDPYYFSPEATKEIYNFTGDNQKTVLLFPEVEGRGADVAWLMENMLYPLAKHAREHNGMLFIRSKNIFWLGNIYEEHWNRLISGEFADVFIPSMEETSDKTMELSLAGRLGVWCAGSTDIWGSRCARDNTSYNRLREHSHQMIPNHFLRNMIYQISYGAQYLDNFAVNQEYMSTLWELIAKGILYVPKREEIVSFNPVHLSIVHPKEEYLNDGNEVKWVTKFDEQKSKEPRVFSRMNGSWPAAPITDYDFSNYAAGTKERRLDFISSYNNGMVLITPPYDESAPRGTLESHLHPIYKGKTVEYFTDGIDYYSDKEMTKSFKADKYYTTVESAIQKGSKMMPLTVKGEVGWVAAQSAPTHLRVTLIDGGYLNPSKKEATIVIGSAKVKSITDLITGEKLKISGGECKVTVDCGHYMFLDVELSETLK